jgi:hypothetical protein
MVLHNPTTPIKLSSRTRRVSDRLSDLKGKAGVPDSVIGRLPFYFSPL